MDILLLVLLVAVFILPSFLMMRRQRRQQGELQSMQATLGTGDRVVTVAGIHGTIISVREAQVDLEIARGVEITMDRIAIMRKATPEDLGVSGGATPDAGEQIGYQHPEYPSSPDSPNSPGSPDSPEHPENQ